MGRENLRSNTAFQEIQTRFFLPWELLEEYAIRLDNDPELTHKFLSEESKKNNQVTYSEDGFISYVIVHKDSRIWQGTETCEHMFSPCDCSGPVRAVCLSCSGRFSIKRKYKNGSCFTCGEGKLVPWEFLSKSKKKDFIEGFPGDHDLKKWLEEHSKRHKGFVRKVLLFAIFLAVFSGIFWFAFSFDVVAEVILSFFLFPVVLLIWGILKVKWIIHRDGSLKHNFRNSVGFFLSLCIKKTSLLFSLITSVVISISILQIVPASFRAVDELLSSEDSLWFLGFIFLLFIVISYLYDANSAANYETEIITRADQANRLYLKNNQELSSNSKEDRLQEIEGLKNDGKISNEEYRSARKKIIES
jgi:hypothetical protein